MPDHYEWTLIEARWNEQGRLLLAHPNGGSTWVETTLDNDMPPEAVVQHEHPGRPVAELVAALREIAALCPEEPEYDDWGGDTERAESWGIAAGQHAAGNIARKALGVGDV